MKTLLWSTELHLLTGTCLPAGDDELPRPRSLPTTPWSWDHSSRAPTPPPPVPPFLAALFLLRPADSDTCLKGAHGTWLRGAVIEGLFNLCESFTAALTWWTTVKKCHYMKDAVSSFMHILTSVTKTSDLTTGWDESPWSETQTLEKEQLISCVYNFVTRKKRHTHRKCLICLFWWSPGLN